MAFASSTAPAIGTVLPSMMYEEDESIGSPLLSCVRYLPTPSKCSSAMPSGLMMLVWQPLQGASLVASSTRWRFVELGICAGSGGTLFGGGGSAGHKILRAMWTPRVVVFGV